MTNPQTTGHTQRCIAALPFVAGAGAQAHTCPPRLPSIIVVVDHLRGASVVFLLTPFRATKSFPQHSSARA